MTDSRVGPSNHPYARGIVPQKFSDRTGGDHLEQSVAAIRVAMIMPGENVGDARLVEQLQIPHPRSCWDVEVLVELIGLFDKPTITLDHYPQSPPRRPR